MAALVPDWALPGSSRPIALAPLSANHRAPSRPRVIPVGALPWLGRGNSPSRWPEGSISPIAPQIPVLMPGESGFWAHAPSCSVNHRLAPGPETMPVGALAVLGSVNSLAAAWAEPTGRTASPAGRVASAGTRRTLVLNCSFTVVAGSLMVRGRDDPPRAAF